MGDVIRSYIEPRENEQAGVQALCTLLDRIRELPEVLLPGFEEAQDEDDSVRFNVEGAAKLIDETLASAPRQAFLLALAIFVTYAARGRVEEPDVDWFASVLQLARPNVIALHGAAA